MPARSVAGGVRAAGVNARSVTSISRPVALLCYQETYSCSYVFV